MTAKSTCPECKTEIYYDEDSQKWICSQCGWQEERKMPTEDVSSRKNDIILKNSKDDVVAHLYVVSEGNLHPDSWIKTPTINEEEETEGDEVDDLHQEWNDFADLVKLIEDKCPFDGDDVVVIKKTGITGHVVGTTIDIYELDWEILVTNDNGDSSVQFLASDLICIDEHIKQKIDSLNTHIKETESRTDLLPDEMDAEIKQAYKEIENLENSITRPDLN